MSARDSASGSSDWKGGGGGATANGGIGGGMGGGLGGGGAGRNGGYGQSTGMGAGAHPVGGLAAAVVPVRRVKNLFVPPPQPVRYKMAPTVAPAKYPVGTLAAAMKDNIFNQPAAPTVTPASYEVPADVVPGFGETYTPPAVRSLPAPAPTYSFLGTQAKPVNVYGGLGQATYPGGRQKTITDRVPQSDGFGQSPIKF